MEPAVQSAIVAAVGGAIGWFANHWLSTRRDERKRQLEARLKFVERQIEELYGPLAAALHEGRQAFRDLLLSLGRPQVFTGSDPLPEDEHKTWLYWTETDLLPRNEFIKNLLKSKAHLVAGATFPASHVAFLDHCNSWAINHRRWKDQNVPYAWRSRIDWPEAFEQEALATFADLKAKHAQLLGELTATGD